MKRILVAALAFGLSTPADARRRAHRRPPVKAKRVVVNSPVHVRVAVSPWSPRYVPVATRAGYVWVAGWYNRGAWVPGYWRPIGPPPRPGLVFVVGHWNGDSYVDGYYRAETRSGYVWVDGYYDETGEWVDGGWRDESTDEWDTEVTGDVQMILINDDGGDDTVEIVDGPGDAEPQEVHALPPVFD